MKKPGTHQIRNPLNPLDQPLFFVYDVYHVILIPFIGKSDFSERKNSEACIAGMEETWVFC